MKNITHTLSQYDAVMQQCKNLFVKKTIDYGTAWRVLRPQSITDQIFIKAQRIRTLEQTGTNKVGEDIVFEYIGIINYSIIGMMQLDLPEDSPMELDKKEAQDWYEKLQSETKSLMEAKNHDYGEAWRAMRVSSLTDLILMKLLRVKQIEDNKGKTLVSEGVKANYQDMLNYAVFALIKLGFHQSNTSKNAE